MPRLSDIKTLPVSEAVRKLNPEIYGEARKSTVEPAGVSSPPMPVTLPSAFTIPGQPMGKPRMTQRDKWAKRGCVLRYRDWADRARACSPAGMLNRPMSVKIVAYFEMPKSWPKKKRREMAGSAHRVKPDADNIAKCAMDALWKDDSCIAELSVSKRWAGEVSGPRMDVEVLP